MGCSPYIPRVTQCLSVPSRWNWDPPPPLPQASVPSPPAPRTKGGRGYTLACMWGVGGVPHLTTGEKAEYSVYSVGCPHAPQFPHEGTEGWGRQFYFIIPSDLGLETRICFLGKLRAFSALGYDAESTLLENIIPRVLLAYAMKKVLPYLGQFATI